MRLREVLILRAPSVGATGGVNRTGDTRLVLVTSGGEAGLALCRPDVDSLEPGVLKLPTDDALAVRLRTVAGPLLLSFETQRAMASAHRILTEELSH